MKLPGNVDITLLYYHSDITYNIYNVCKLTDNTTSYKS